MRSTGQSWLALDHLDFNGKDEASLVEWQASAPPKRLKSVFEMHRRLLRGPCDLRLFVSIFATYPNRSVSGCTQPPSGVNLLGSGAVRYSSTITVATGSYFVYSNIVYPRNDWNKLSAPSFGDETTVSPSAKLTRLEIAGQNFPCTVPQSSTRFCDDYIRKIHADRSP